MKLILVRHGETEWNVKELVQGQSGIPLNKTGLEQAKKVGMRLKREKIDFIYSSDLERAKQTAAEIAKFHKVPVMYSKLIRERNFGSLEGVPREDYRKVREKAGLPKHLYRPPGGENYIDLKKRVQRFISMVKKKHSSQNVLVVAHGGIIKTFITILLKRPITDIYNIEQHNTAVNVIEIKRGSPAKVHYLNSTEHL